MLLMYRQRKAVQILFTYVKSFKTFEATCAPKLNHVQSSSYFLGKLNPCNSLVYVGRYGNGRSFHSSTLLLSLSEREIKKYMNEISDKFEEAMELMSDAVRRSSMGTIYFSDDMTDAETIIEEVLKDYENFLGKLSESQSRDVTRAIGLKMEELKAQLQLLKDSIKE